MLAVPCVLTIHFVLIALAQTQYQSVHKLRGQGTFVAFDLRGGAAQRDKLVAKLRANGTGCCACIVLLVPSACFVSSWAFIFVLHSQYVFTGVESGGCGEASMRLRPMLVFKPRHAEQFLTLLERSLKDMQA